MKIKRIGANSLMEGIRLNSFSVKRINDSEKERDVYKNGIPIEDPIAETFKHKGGILVFPSESSVHALPDDLFIRSIPEFLKTGETQPQQDEPYSLTFGYYVNGKYNDEGGSIYNENARGVEIVGISPELLDKLAYRLSKELKQGPVLVKNYETDKLYLIE